MLEIQSISKWEVDFAKLEYFLLYAEVTNFTATNQAFY